jgi:hypothetical protein
MVPYIINFGKKFIQPSENNPLKSVTAAIVGLHAFVNSVGNLQVRDPNLRDF